MQMNGCVEMSKRVQGKREFEAQEEKVITAVSRVDLRVIMAATLV